MVSNSTGDKYFPFHGMVYEEIVGISMGTNCAPLIADLFLYCYERDFMSTSTIPLDILTRYSLL